MPTTKSILLGADAPRVLSVPMIAAVLANRRKLPARNTLFRWIREQTKSGALRPVTRGLYINQLARPLPTAADAAGFVRGGAIVSLQTVLGEAGVTNGYSDIVTCVLPHSKDHRPSVRPRNASSFAFMRCQLAFSMSTPERSKIASTWTLNIPAQRRKRRYSTGSILAPLRACCPAQESTAPASSQGHEP
jgi:hypothetical protein